LKAQILSNKEKPLANW